MQLNCVWNGHVINTRAKPVPTPYPTCHTSDHMPSLLFCPTFVRRCPLYLWPNRLPNSPALLPPSLFYDPEDPGPGAGCRRQAVVVWWCSFSTVKQFLLPLLSPSPAASRCRGRLCPYNQNVHSLPELRASLLLFPRKARGAPFSRARGWGSVSRSHSMWATSSIQAWNPVQRSIWHAYTFFNKTKINRPSYLLHS